MKRFLFILALAILGCKDNSGTSGKSTQPSVDSTAKSSQPAVEEVPETHETTFGDSTVTLQKYYMVFLKRTGKRAKNTAHNAKVTKQHLHYLKSLKIDGYAGLQGNFDDHGDIRQVVIFNTPSRKKVDSLVKADPAIKAGMMKAEIHPWWTEKGGKLE